MQGEPPTDRGLRVLLVNDLPPGPTGGAEVHLGRLAQALVEAGCSVEVAWAQRPHAGWRRVLDLWDPAARRSIRRTVSEFRPDVIHYHNLLNELSSSVVGLGRPSVLTVHDPRLVGVRFGPDQDDPRWDPKVVLRSVKNRLARARLRRAVGATIAPSNSLVQRLVDARFQRVSHVANFAALSPAGPPGADVLYVGALQPHKGPQVLLDAWVRIAAQHPGSVLCYIGDGPLRGEIEARARQAGIAQSVRVLGTVEPDAVAPLLGAAAMVVVPSLGVEGGGPTLAVIEAMAAGRPVIVTDRPGVSEGVDPSVGVVVRSGDPDALATAIHGLLGDRELLQRLGVNAARRAAERWDPAAAAGHIIAIYESVLR